MVTTLEETNRTYVEGSRNWKYWQRREAKFSQPTKPFRFLANYSDSSKPEKVVIFARTLEQAVRVLTDEGTVAVLSYASADKNFKPYKPTFTKL